MNRRAFLRRVVGAAVAVPAARLLGVEAAEAAAPEPVSYVQVDPRPFDVMELVQARVVVPVTDDMLADCVLDPGFEVFLRARLEERVEEWVRSGSSTSSGVDFEVRG